jgi:DNA-binding transcriptional LysR family regulator
MKRDDLSDLAAFTVVAEEKSFTRAAARLGISPSALSHAMKSLEARLGIRLLARSTRSVSTTQVGESLLQTLQPAFAQINTELNTLSAQRDKPAGTVRITTFKYAAVAVLWPVLPSFLVAHPDVKVEITIDDGLTDIVANRYDAGIRFAISVEKDMIGVVVGPEVRFAIVASPEYFARHSKPKTPHDLSQHRCINYRLTNAGKIVPWRFEENGKAFLVKVNGPIVSNDNDTMLTAALAGLGITRLFEGLVEEHIAAGRLVRVLTKWCPIAPRLQLYHSSHRQTPPALAALIGALREHFRREGERR